MELYVIILYCGLFFSSAMFLYIAASFFVIMISKFRKVTLEKKLKMPFVKKNYSYLAPNKKQESEASLYYQEIKINDKYARIVYNRSFFS